MKVLKNRLIPVVLMRGGICVQSKGFRRYQRLGNPTQIVERLSDWASDELIYLDISGDEDYDLGREDLRDGNCEGPLEILTEIAQRCFMPLTFGGRIRSLQDIADRIRRGADKVSLNTHALDQPEFINQAAEEFGSQCIVVNVDARREGEDWEAYADGGCRATGKSAAHWAQEAQDRGAGEILIQSIDCDGRGAGYDIDLVRSITSTLQIPVIALGGAGTWQHMEEVLTHGGARAVAAANIFNYTENSVFNAKQHLFDHHCKVRQPIMGVRGFKSS